MKKILLVAFLCFLIAPVFSQQFTPLWPDNNMPNSQGMKLEHVEARQRITQVVAPGMYAFFPSYEENTGAAVLIFPSGGYHHLTYNLGGFQLAKWFNTIGINAFVVIYRLPTSPDLIEKDKGPLQDAQRALKLIRANSSSWQIDPEKIGVFGTSAGGHLASTLGTHHQDYARVGDSLDKVSTQANFMILISPVISTGEYAHQGSIKNLLGEAPSEELLAQYSNELRVSEETPPTFLVHAQNDHVVPVMNSILFYQALTEKGVNASLHIFPKGDHAIALINKSELVDSWTNLCEGWLAEIGLLDKATK